MDSNQTNKQIWQYRNDQNGRRRKNPKKPSTSAMLPPEATSPLKLPEKTVKSPNKLVSRQSTSGSGGKSKSRSVELIRRNKYVVDENSDTRSYTTTSKNQRINKAICLRMSHRQDSEAESESKSQKVATKKSRRFNQELKKPLGDARCIEAAMSLFGYHEDESDLVNASPSNEFGNNEQSLADASEAREKLRTIFKGFATLCEGMTIELINKEFSELPPPPKEKECAEFHKNRRRNRYQDIFCMEASRVKLQFLADEVGGNDYIHANRVDYPSFKSRYILTQGPRKNTVIDFWRMVWQEKTSVIVMLCQLVEGSREKCSEYYPKESGPTMLLGNGLIKVTNMSQHTVDGVVTSQLKLCHLSSERIVTHYQWTEWPDYTVPDSKKSETIFKILRHIRWRNTPVVVHCSAGIGRSGTLIAIEMCLMDCLHSEVPQVSRAVRFLRLKGRSQAIQSVVQYMAIRKVVLDFGITHNLIDSEDFPSFSSLYEESVHIAQQTLQK
ncbi:unnamed protein product [Caenorhabditis auriculariae]|uniref:Uncharacterized protein n=1 Tax=Caenorhabditis auriculariae TaxID=2777116 RepID=A0A8S1HE92_9PELO|nr:unnamed protein product [Caenorhabditis auriculariae]